MPLDDYVGEAVERVLAEVRAPLDVTLRELAGTIAIDARAADVRFTEEIRLLDEGVVVQRCPERARRLCRPRSGAKRCAGRGSRRIKGWHSSGFGGVVADAMTIDLPSDPPGLLGEALSAKTLILSRASTGRIPADDRPSFAHGTDRRDAVAAPVVLGGSVAAVVYADAPSAGDETPSWVAAVERLARYAGLVLEVRIARYLTGARVESPEYGVSGRNRGASGGRW